MRSWERTAAAIVRGLKEIFKPVVFLATSFRVSSFCVQSAVQGDRGRSHSGPVLLDGEVELKRSVQRDVLAP